MSYCHICTMGIFSEEEAIFIPIDFILKIQTQQQLFKCFAFPFEVLC